MTRTPSDTAQAGHLSNAPTPSLPEPQRVEVNLGDRSYQILIGRGLLAHAGTLCAQATRARAAAIVTDANVARVHADAVETSLAAAGLRTARVVVPPGEGSKCYMSFAEVCDRILAARIERADIVVALGGGVVGDLAGFAAASVRRGLRFVQMPTSLLAQVDSSVGGKTGINSVHGKNLVGAFWQPSLVVADTGVLDSLPAREFRAGYAEVAKYGLIDRPDFFEWLERHAEEIFSGGPAREEAIAVSCRAKAEIVARDEREDGDRALLNLGHTFGHAVEAVTGYDGARLVHGEGVAIGMCLALRFSVMLGHASGQDAERVAAHLRRIGLPTRLQDVPGGVGGRDALLAAMRQDKKVQAGALTFILAQGIGRSFIARGVPEADVAAFLDAELART